MGIRGKLLSVVIASGVLLALAAFSQDDLPAAEKVKFTTSDGVEIHGTFYPAVTTEGGKDKVSAVILLHMYRKTRKTWRSVAPEFQKRGIAVLAIDLRGHGESTKKNGEDYPLKKFKEEDFKNMVLDVEAAKAYLLERGDIGSIAIVGASLGANVAIVYVQDDRDVKCVVLLSPGLDYKGVQTEKAMKKYGKRPLMIVVSKEDEYSHDSSRKLFRIAEGQGTGVKRSLLVLEGAGHGTDMFEKEKGLAEEIVGFIAEQVE